MPKHKGRHKRPVHGPPKRVAPPPAGVGTSLSVAVQTTEPVAAVPRRAPTPQVKTTPRPMINVGSEVKRIAIVTAIILALLVIAVLVFR
ncbi:MAG: hypothetical protein HYX81_01660 [Chloroflexi bacterium]|nr:hypothetical protein [Chloroflexota bacterium]